ncbi:MAG: VCBS repeat-containing protein [Planctomycetota bacterium]|nr:VCBS repeat-containing protein [Planctomycetota bacterium]
MRRAAWLPLLLLLALASPPVHADDHVLELEADGQISQLRRADVNGDGVEDLLLGAGREVLVWSGAKGELPEPKPRWRFVLPPTASFVDVAPPGNPGPRLASLGREGFLFVNAQSKAQPGTVGRRDLGWSDRERVTFLELYQEGGGLLLPTPTGFELVREGRETVRFPVDIDATVSEAGPFLEDTTDVLISHPQVVLGARPWAGTIGPSPTLWALSGTSLVAQTGDMRTTYDVSFLPGDGDRRLLDLDGDARPDLVHRTSTNFEASYVFFQTPEAKPGADGKPPTKAQRPGPANTVLRLSGHPIEHDFVDLNADGRLDFVATTIEIDGKNTVAALTSGTVRAQTRAFLNRAGTPGATRWFASEPDANVTSEVGVRILFTYAGQIDVQRQLTIVVDGDYDGDGLLDLLIRTGPKTLTIWPGTKQGGWAAEGREIAIPPLGAYANIEGYAYDADGDGKDEVFLLYRAVHRDGTGTETRERLFLVSPAK